MSHGAARDEPFFVLVPSFFRRIVENDLVPEDLDLSDALSWVVPLFAAPPAVVALWLLPKYSLMADLASDQFAVLSRGDKLFFIGYSMAVVGFVTALLWERLFPDRRDAFILGVLPLRGWTVAGARFVAFALFLLGFVLAINLLAALGFVAAAAGSGTLIDGARYLVAHLTATVGGGIFAFLTLTTIQAACLLILPERAQRAVSIAVQLAFIVTLMQWLVFSPGILAKLTGDEPLLLGSGLSAWAPPVWFLGLYEACLGTDEALLKAMAARGVFATLLALGTTALLCALGYRRLSRRALQPDGTRAAATRRYAELRERIASALIRDPVERAVFGFTVKSFLRSRRHRLALSLYVGMGLSFIVGGFLGPTLRDEAIVLAEPSVVLLSLPLVLSFFTLVGQRVLFTLPTELGAAWIFRMTEARDRRPYAAGARKAALVLGLGPILVLTFPLYAALWGTALAAEHTAFWLLMALILSELLLITFHSVPYTSPYVPGKANVKLLWPVYLLAMSIYAYTASRLAVWLLRDPTRWTVACTLLLTALAGLRVYRSLTTSREPLVFETAPEPEVQRLGIAS